MIPSSVAEWARSRFIKRDLSLHFFMNDLGDVALQGDDAEPFVMSVDKRDWVNTLIWAVVCWSAVFMALFDTRKSHLITQNIDVVNDGWGLFAPVSINQITPYHLFMMIDVAVTREPNASDSMADLHVSVYSPENSTNRVFSSSRRYHFVFDGLVSRPAVIFFDKLLYRSSYSITVNIHNRDSVQFTGAKVSLTFANPVVSYGLLVNRTYACILLVAIIGYLVYTVAFKSTRSFVPTSEQKLTFVLVLCCAVADDPFEFLYFSRPSMIFVGLRATFNALFTYFARYYIIALFDSVRCQRKRESSRKWLATVIVFVCVGILDTLASIWHEVEIANTRISDPDASILAVNYMCVLVSNFMVVVYVWMAIASLDETERFRFWVYLGNSALFLVISSTISIVRLLKPLSDVDVPLLTVELMTNTVFVVSMVAAHWPVIEAEGYRNPEAPVIDEIELEENVPHEDGAAEIHEIEAEGSQSSS